MDSRAYPLTGDMAAVLATAQDRRASDIGRGFGWLFRCIRQAWRAAGKTLDSVAAIR